MKPFQVVVGNVGQVYDGSNYMQARERYRTYVKLSKAPYGRASGESVTLFHNGEIKVEYVGTIEQKGDTEKESPAPRKGQTQTGYGRAMPLPHMVRWGGRWWRVKVVCFSNAGSCYVGRQFDPQLTVDIER